MKRSHMTISLLMCLLLIYSGIQGQVVGNKKVVTQERELPSFTAISVGGSFNVYLTQSDIQKVAIETDENLLERITTMVSNDELTISTKVIKNATKLNVYLQVPILKKLTINGAAKLQMDGILEATNLEIEASGASHTQMEIDVTNLKTNTSGASVVSLTGLVGHHTIKASGASHIYAQHLESEETVVKASGASVVYANSEQELLINTTGAARVVYDPEPEMLIHTGEDDVVLIERDEDDFIVVDTDKEIYKSKTFGIEVYDDNDSTEVIIGRHRLSIDDDGNVKWDRRFKRKFNGHWAGIDLGVNGYLTPGHDMQFKPEYQYLDLRMEKSLMLGINFFEQNLSLSKNQKWGLVTGLGWEAHNYRFKNNVMITSDSAKITGFYASGISMRKSKLVVNYLTIPLLFEFQTNRYMKKNSFHLTAGVIGGVRIYSHTKRYFEETDKAYDLLNPVTGKLVLHASSPGNKKVKEWDAFHLNPFKLEAAVRIGWGFINLFGSYSLTELFRKGQGPELYPFTAGITLVGW